MPTNLWSSKHTKINSGGGQWDPPTFDSQGNLYIGVANPAPFTGSPKYPWGSSRPGPDLYTDSIVKLNAATGKLIWYYQLTPHDIYDWDMENSPLLATANGQQIVIDGGKAGILVAVNAQTGKLVWKRPVGVHNGHDNDHTLAQAGKVSTLHIPETVEPGDLGGIESQLASNGTTVFAAVNDCRSPISRRMSGVTDTVPVSKATGDLVAVNEATGAVEWNDKLPVFALRCGDTRQQRRVHDDVQRDDLRIQRVQRPGAVALEAVREHERSRGGRREHRADCRRLRDRRDRSR